MNSASHVLLWILLLSSAHGLQVEAQEIRFRQREFGGESAVKVTINGGNGTFVLKRATSNDVYSVREKSQSDGPSEIRTQYEVKSGVGYLTMELNTAEDSDDLNVLSTVFNEDDNKEYYITLTEQIPVYLDMKIGAGESRLDLSGLRLRRLTLECGAAALRIRVGEVNPEVLQEVIISAGIGQVLTDHLGNLNFESLEFEGGLGDYQLDFRGALRARSRVSTELGVGSLRIILPREAGALARSNDSWFQSTSFDGFGRSSEGVYSTDNYGTAAKNVLLKVESGIGSVAVTRQ